MLLAGIALPLLMLSHWIPAWAEVRLPAPSWSRLLPPSQSPANVVHSVASSADIARPAASPAESPETSPKPIPVASATGSLPHSRAMKLRNLAGSRNRKQAHSDAATCCRADSACPTQKQPLPARPAHRRLVPIPRSLRRAFASLVHRHRFVDSALVQSHARRGRRVWRHGLSHRHALEQPHLFSREHRLRHRPPGGLLGNGRRKNCALCWPTRARTSASAISICNCLQVCTLHSPGSARSDGGSSASSLN